MSEHNTFLIAIMSSDKKSIIGCYSVKAVKVAGSQKYVLSGVVGISALGEHTSVLGTYKCEEDVQKEISEIFSAVSRGERAYVLKYCSDVFEREKQKGK